MSDPSEHSAPRPLAAAEEHLFHTQQIIRDEEQLLDLEKQEVDGIIAGLNDRPPAEAAGVDVKAFTAVDPSFDDKAFIAIARESFNHIREARSEENAKTAAGTMSDQLKSELQNAIEGDVASHRHHLLPGLSIMAAEITSATVTDGKMTAVVHFKITSQEMDRDEKFNMIAGSTDWQSWDEMWTFWRDPSVDTSASDEDHILSREQEGGWMFAHKGWIVTKIERVGAQDPLDPTNI
jgi:predicted lipid-binding transport protein (Tim44 family)